MVTVSVILKSGRTVVGKMAEVQAIELVASWSSLVHPTPTFALMMPMPDGSLNSFVEYAEVAGIQYFVDKQSPVVEWAERFLRGELN